MGEEKVNHFSSLLIGKLSATVNGLQFGLAPPKAVGVGGKEPQDSLPPN